MILVWACDLLAEEDREHVTLVRDLNRECAFSSTGRHLGDHSLVCSHQGKIPAVTLCSRREMIRGLAALGGGAALALGDSTSEPAPTYEDSEAYGIYSTLTSKDGGWVAVAKAEFLVLAAQTVSSKMCLKPEGESAHIIAPAVANYEELAAKRWRLERRFSLAKPYTLIDQQELDMYFSKGGSGWKGFYARYPNSGGYLFFSPVGFNSDKDIAVVQMNHWCSSQCGVGTFSVLQKEGGEWKDMKWQGSSCAWIS